MLNSIFSVWTTICPKFPFEIIRFRLKILNMNSAAHCMHKNRMIRGTLLARRACGRESAALVKRLEWFFDFNSQAVTASVWDHCGSSHSSSKSVISRIQKFWIKTRQSANHPTNSPWATQRKEHKPVEKPVHRALLEMIKSFLAASSKSGFFGSWMRPLCTSVMLLRVY